MKNSHGHFLGWLATILAIDFLTGFFFYTSSFYIFTRTPLLAISALFFVIAALLNIMLVWRLHLINFSAQSPWLSRFAMIIGVLGSDIVFIGTANDFLNTIAGHNLIVSFPFSQAQSIIVVGYGFIGIWLLMLNYQARMHDTWPHRLAWLGILTGIIMAAGLFALPRVFIPYVSLYHKPGPELGELVGNLGWMVIYPMWSIWFGREALKGQDRDQHLQSFV